MVTDIRPHGVCNLYWGTVMTVVYIKLRNTLAKIVFANMFGKFIFPLTSCELGEGDKPTMNYQQLCENCWQHRKIFLRTWKRTKIWTNTVPTELGTSFQFIEKTSWRWFVTNCLRTVGEPHTNYTNFKFTNQFANKMFASVYAA